MMKATEECFQKYRVSLMGESRKKDKIHSM